MKTYGTLADRKGAWHIETEPHVVLKLKRCFPKVSRKQHGEIRLSDSIETARDLEWFVSRYPLSCVDDETERRLAEQASRHREQENLVAEFLAGLRHPRQFELALPMRDYQAIALELLIASGGLLVGDEVGLGKTLVGIGLATLAEAQPSLVVTMTHLTHQWADEFQRFAPGIRTHILKKGTPYDLTERTRSHNAQSSLFPEKGFPDVIITNYHKLSGWAETLAPVIRSVTFDEIAELRRGEASQKGSAAIHLAKRCAFRCGLSATPIFNLGSEIHAIMAPLRPNALGDRSEFLEEWCGSTNSRGSAPLKDPPAFGTWMRDAGLMIRRTRTDVGRELPPVTQSIQHIDANPDALSAIERPAEELSRIILGESQLARGDKFRASGDLEGLVRQATGLAKAPAVAEFCRMILDSEEKLVVFAWHRSVYEVLMGRFLEFKPVLYTGSETPTQKEKSKHAFCSGDSRVLLMSLRAGAGLNGLQEVCRTCFFAELDWSPAVHRQNVGRLARDGQIHPVLAYFGVTDCGSDPIIVDVLGLKKVQADGIVDPRHEMLEQVDGSGEHGRMLAQLYVKSRNARAAE